MSEFDKNTTCLAGEFLTVGKLCKRGLQATVTLGNAKAIDILARNPENDKEYSVQVKTHRENEKFILPEQDIEGDHIFVFVVLNKFEDKEDFFIVKGSEILNNVNDFYGPDYKSENPPKVSAIHWKSLEKYKDHWEAFDQ